MRRLGEVPSGRSPQNVDIVRERQQADNEHGQGHDGEDDGECDRAEECAEGVHHHSQASTDSYNGDRLADGNVGDSQSPLAPVRDRL